MDTSNKKHSSSWLDTEENAASQFLFDILLTLLWVAAFMPVYFLMNCWMTMRKALIFSLQPSWMIHSKKLLEIIKQSFSKLWRITSEIHIHWSQKSSYYNCFTDWAATVYYRLFLMVISLSFPSQWLTMKVIVPLVNSYTKGFLQ